MITTAFVVVIRPFQLLLACASLAIASLDQFYLESNVRLWILLGLIVPATLLAITVSVHTTFAYAHRHELGGWVLTLRWFLDLLALLLMSAAVPFLLFSRASAIYHMVPPIPFLTIELATISVNMACFVATAFMLALEDYVWRTQDKGTMPHRHRIEHVTHNEAIWQPRPLVAPKEIALVTERVSGDPYDWHSPV